jgi:hypothetical protein
LCGVIDKASVGNASLGIIHAVFELYGPELAGRLLTAFGRLFTYFLQGIYVYIYIYVYIHMYLYKYIFMFLYTFLYCISVRAVSMIQILLSQLIVNHF